MTCNFIKNKLSQEISFSGQPCFWPHQGEYSCHNVYLICSVFSSGIVFYLVIPGTQLYQFLLKLLDENEVSILQWVRKHDGLFQIIDKEKLASRWSEKKSRQMTYASLSRALRYYYGKGILKPVSNKLQYQFTTSALEEWERIRYLNKIEWWQNFCGLIWRCW